MSAGLPELLSTWFYVSDPNSYVVVSGIFIPDMKIIKSGFKWPLQNATIIDIRPLNYEFILRAMTIEKLNFTLPASFTIGPDLTGESKLTFQDIDNLKLYARYLANSKKVDRDKVIESIIEGETRSSAGLLKIEEIFNDRLKFKDTIIRDVNEELRQFGLKVMNANIKELNDLDSEDSNYFKNMQKKILSQSENQAKIDIATTLLKGETEAKEKDTERKLKSSELETICITGVKNNEVKMEIELSKLETGKVYGKNEQSENVIKSNTKLAILKNEQDKLK
jgi:flotillin